MRIFVTTFLVPILMTAVTFSGAISLPSGITGRTLRPGSVPGCAMSGCHNGVENASVTIKAPAFLRTNEVARCTVLVTGANTGIDISVSDGVLAPVSRLLAVNGELTHPSPGLGVYIFDYTAPSVAGTQTLYATGLSGGTGGPWNFAVNSLVYVDLVASTQNDPLPAGFNLGQNFPNPFNPGTRIRYSIARKGRATLKVYNLLGEVVAVLVDDVVESGQHTVMWNASGFPSGIYIYRLESGGAVETKRMILLK